FVLPLGAQAADTGDQVNLLGFNDFHGALSAGSAFACTVTSTQEQHPNSALLSAGDSVGGTEFASAVQDDEPTIDFLNALGVGATAIGNHEYDQGYDDLTDRIEPRTDFPDLAANVYLESGERAHEPYAIVDAGDVRVAVVGAVTTKTIGKVSPAAIEGLEFRDPVDSLNEAMAELQDSGEDYDVVVAPTTRVPAAAGPPARRRRTPIPSSTRSSTRPPPRSTRSSTATPIRPTPIPPPGPTTRSGPWSRPVTTAACWARSPSSTGRPTGGAWPRTDSS